MDSPTNLSSPARVPAFEARFSPQDVQEFSMKGLLEEDNGDSNTQYAAGGVRSSPLASTCPPSMPFTSFDQLRALLSTYFPAEVDAGSDFGLPNSGSPFNTSTQGSELSLSSSLSSSPPSSITSPVSDESSLSFASPDLPFHELSTIDQDPPLQACQYPLTVSFSPNSQSYSTPPKQYFFQSVALPEELPTPDVPISTDQSVGIAFPGSNSLLAVPSFLETTALGLYYPSNPQNVHLPPLLIQAGASILTALPPPTPSVEVRKVRAAVPTGRSQRVRSGKMRPSSDAVGAVPTGTDEECVLKCPVCGFPQSTQRKGDFLRHMRTHEDAKLTRYVCCGIPATHPAAAGVSTGHSVLLYKGCAFYGGCGKSYSRMDALQRHLGKSGCAGGSAKDHQIWRQLYL